MIVTAIRNFDHGGLKKRGDVFDVSDYAAKKLREKRLVRFETDAPCFQSLTVGEKLSALPADLVSPQTIAKKSKRGRMPKMSAV